jgi:hypothetical protein
MREEVLRKNPVLRFIVIIPLASRAIHRDQICGRSKSEEGVSNHGRIDHSHPDRWNSYVENKTNGLCGGDVLKPYEVMKRYFLHMGGSIPEKKKGRMNGKPRDPGNATKLSG